ncbi:hypothetical protein [uncultured Winogradskyella sp.]|uniref:hypothetical protein n=1 Tax=uncultured Winogradskyella sp. TaxID=395353 RepID=UPI00261BB30F|nr:hypothetical protein [uncultured Winogradskyella sp.]
MKLLKSACYAIVFAGIFATTLQCASPKEVTTTFEKPTSFKVKSVYFQEWYAGIKVGGTGVNVFVPVVNKRSDITIDSVYFKNLKGKLVVKDDKYFAILKNDSPYYTFRGTQKSDDYPFTLNNNECAIRYIENGETKYLKVVNVREMEGTYYENGPPSIYDNKSSTIVATNDDDSE